MLDGRRALGGFVRLGGFLGLICLLGLVLSGNDVNDLGFELGTRLDVGSGVNALLGPDECVDLILHAVGDDTHAAQLAEVGRQLDAQRNETLAHITCQTFDSSHDNSLGEHRRVAAGQK